MMWLIFHPDLIKITVLYELTPCQQTDPNTFRNEMRRCNKDAFEFVADFTLADPVPS